MNEVYETIVNCQLSYFESAMWRNNVGPKDINDRFLLHLAVDKGCFPIVKYLLKYGADPYRKDKKKHTALYHAREQEDFYDIMGMPVNSEKRQIYPYLKKFAASKRIQNNVRAKAARTKAKAKLHTKVKQVIKPRFGFDVSDVIASFLIGEPNTKDTFITFKKKEAKKLADRRRRQKTYVNTKTFNTRLRESAKKNGVKLTTRCLGKRVYKSDPVLRVQIANARKRKCSCA
jgi:hypothetical protein